MGDQALIDVVEGLAPSVFGRDRSALSASLTDDVVLHVRGAIPNGDFHGVEGVLDGFSGVIGLVDDVDIERIFCMTSDCWVAEFEHATLRRDGRALDSSNAFIYRFDGEKIAEMWMLTGASPAEVAALLG
jgi:ketosteroid isomerase-like protein